MSRYRPDTPVNVTNKKHSIHRVRERMGNMRETSLYRLFLSAALGPMRIPRAITYALVLGEKSRVEALVWALEAAYT